MDEDWDRERNQRWYHGSQQEIPVLQAGSSITQNRDIARAFSHRPTLVSIDGGIVKHDGTVPGYLYLIAEKIQSADVYPHPHPVNRDRWEWLTTRNLRVRLVERTAVSIDEHLTDDDITELRRK